MKAYKSFYFNKEKPLLREYNHGNRGIAQLLIYTEKKQEMYFDSFFQMLIY